METEDLLINIIKQQARLFLLDAAEFYPFGSAINDKGVLTPVAAYVESENDNPTSQELIDLLEKAFKKNLSDGSYKMAIIAVDVILRENGVASDAIQLRFFEKNTVYYKTLKYIIKDNDVEFAW